MYNLILLMFLNHFYTYKGKHTVFDLRKCDLGIFYKMETSRYKKYNYDFF